MSEMPSRDPDVLTTAELAAKLGLSPQTVRRMANSGQLPALKTGKDFRFSWEAVRQVLRSPYREDAQPDRGAGHRARTRARAATARHPD
ncbi:helix-turn-helix domain-containing protein [Actinomadura atramentaria]|uniref:helix-turn-helix domain-containing protein n=1 Tax=Actinomadura atramentaria TaxID=1990 RepID=UPI000381AB82|nr:helix-turn-helix domain-containing protein [Actinomadura atramentaria]